MREKLKALQDEGTREFLRQRLGEAIGFVRQIKGEITGLIGGMGDLNAASSKAVSPLIKDMATLQRQLITSSGATKVFLRQIISISEATNRVKFIDKGAGVSALNAIIGRLVQLRKDAAAAGQSALLSAIDKQIDKALIKLATLEQRLKQTGKGKLLAPKPPPQPKAVPIKIPGDLSEKIDRISKSLGRLNTSVKPTADLLKLSLSLRIISNELFLLKERARKAGNIKLAELLDKQLKLVSVFGFRDQLRAIDKALKSTGDTKVAREGLEKLRSSLSRTINSLARLITKLGATDRALDKA
ncbi:hypothetical protein LCGC14_2863120, partial [marine sediment metagenome]